MCFNFFQKKDAVRERGMGMGMGMGMGNGNGNQGQFINNEETHQY